VWAAVAAGVLAVIAAIIAIFAFLRRRASVSYEYYSALEANATPTTPLTDLSFVTGSTVSDADFANPLSLDAMPTLWVE
jgi:hypothetical protein